VNREACLAERERAVETRVVTFQRERDRGAACHDLQLYVGWVAAQPFRSPRKHAFRGDVDRSNPLAGHQVEREHELQRPVG
jgi:hypothetical protein